MKGLYYPIHHIRNYCFVMDVWTFDISRLPVIMKKIAITLIASAITLNLFAQQQKSGGQLRQFLDSLNRKIDEAVVKKDLTMLQKAYTDDFVFTHGTGLIDSKQSWLRSVADTNSLYTSRVHDSTFVELHNDIAIIKGKLTVTRVNKGVTSGYWLWYLRVYALRSNIWQMVSHRTISEMHRF